MNQQARFTALSQEQKFQFLYYAAKENEAFILNWFKGQSPEQTSAQECIGTILNSFDFLRKIFFPAIDPAIILDKETMLNGMADEILTLSDEVTDMRASKNQARAIAILTSLECLYTTLIDCYFSSEDNDVNKSSFHVILLCAIGYCLHDDYQELLPKINYLTGWEHLEVLEDSYPDVEVTFEKFAENIFTRFKTVDLSLN